MTDEIQIKVPDIGGASDVDVIELLVKPGDDIDVDTPLITLESDKASMEIPSPKAGKIKDMHVKVGDKVSEGDVILSLITDETSHDNSSETKASSPEKPEPMASQPEINDAGKEEKNNAASQQDLTVVIPDIGGATDVDVIDILVKAGDVIEKDQALITLEGDKATMDIPSPAAGTIKSLSIKLGDKVSQGSPILILSTVHNENKAVKETEKKESLESIQPQETASTPSEKSKNEEQGGQIAIKDNTDASEKSIVFAGPAVRRLARELGVDLRDVTGSGRKARITKEDVQAYVKKRLSVKASSGFALPEAPVIDFSKFGSVESQPLNKIKRLTGQNVHRAWLSIPHVTQFDEADITDLEAFRKASAETAAKEGYKLTMLAFVTKVVCKALMMYPQFNASLDAKGENLILKKYYNIGIAVETPNGLVVPVIKQVDQLSVSQIALEMARLSQKAREKGLMPADMSGGCFTISSLGGIGGTAFTPIVNSPEVAILGLSRAVIKPVYDNDAFQPRLMLPLSLSYDHRVIDGAEAARFTRAIAEMLGDIRRIVL